MQWLNNELYKLVSNEYVILNGWISDNIDKEEILDIVKVYKEYRDKD